MTASASDKRFARKVITRLDKMYPEATCSLDFRSPIELLVATILSAQCTDERVNIVTKQLFSKYRSAADYADAPFDDLAEDIKPTGFFRNKAKSIQGCCRKLADEHGGEVPRDLDALVRLPGIGRKTANVVLGTAFGMASGVVVDTHVTRLSRRLGLTEHKDAVKIERDLIERIPKDHWVAFGHQMIHHGRRICKARKPLCDECELDDVCPRIGVT